MVSFPGMKGMIKRKTSFYDRELQGLVPKKGIKPEIKIKLANEDNKSTKWMNLNLDSIESLQAFIDIIKEDLEGE